MRPSNVTALFCMALPWLAGSGGCNGEFRFDDRALLDAALEADATTRCKSDSECSLPSLHCLDGACVPCAQDIHCAAPLGRCDLASHRCVECGLSADCPPNDTCEPSTRTCVRKCGSGDPCPPELGHCDVVRGVCIFCKTSAECTLAGERFVCSVGNGRCVQCTSHSECLAPRPLCDVARGACVKCLRPSDCPIEQPVCDPLAGACR